MKDIQNREDLYVIVNSFYDKLLKNSQINYIFTEVAHIDLKPHLIELVGFWEQILFNKGIYSKNVLQIHLDLNSEVKITPQHFDIWLDYFNLSINENFSGTNAEKMKTHALSIATVMRIKMK